MNRRLLLPVLAAALLGGCVTGYDYRGGNGGDYYYGQPSVEYRDDGYYSPYGYGGYGYPGGWSGTFGLGFGYGGYPYGYGYGGWPYGDPYYGYPYTRPPVIVVPDPRRPHHRGDHDGDAHDGDADDRPQHRVRPRQPFLPPSVQPGMPAIPQGIDGRRDILPPRDVAPLPSPGRFQRAPQRVAPRVDSPDLRQERDDSLKRHH